jgi:hypothetical protein
MSNAKQAAAITVAMNDQADRPVVNAQTSLRTSTSMGQSLDTPMAGAAPTGGVQDGGMLALTALAAVVVLALRRRQR